MSARIVPLTDVDDTLAARWRDLSGEALEPNPFADPDFVLPVARALGALSDVGVAVVDRDERLCFALPVVRQRRYRRLPLPAVTTWLHDYACLGTPLVSRDAPEEAWRGALGLFDSAAPVAALKLMTTDGPVAWALEAALTRDRRRSVLLGERERPIVRRRATPSYMDTLSKDRRKTFRRRRRQLAETLGGELTLTDHAAPGGDLPAAVEAFLALEARGWKGSDGGAMTCRPGHAEFFRTLCRDFAARGQLQMWSLSVGERAVAFQQVLLAGDTVFDFKTAYDEELRRFGPGATLLVDLFAEFHADPRFAIIESCTGLGESLTPQLFPDRRALGEMLLLPAGRVGGAAAWVTPRAATAYRKFRHRGTADQAQAPAG